MGGIHRVTEALGQPVSLHLLTPFGNSPNNILGLQCVYSMQAQATCRHSEDLVQVVLVKVKELRTRGSFSFIVVTIG